MAALLPPLWLSNPAGHFDNHADLAIPLFTRHQFPEYWAEIVNVVRTHHYHYMYIAPTEAVDSLLDLFELDPDVDDASPFRLFLRSVQIGEKVMAVPMWAHQQTLAKLSNRDPKKARHLLHLAWLARVHMCHHSMQEWIDVYAPYSKPAVPDDDAIPAEYVPYAKRSIQVATATIAYTSLNPYRLQTANAANNNGYEVPNAYLARLLAHAVAIAAAAGAAAAPAAGINPNAEDGGFVDTPITLMETKKAAHLDEHTVGELDIAVRGVQKAMAFMGIQQ